MENRFDSSRGFFARRIRFGDRRRFGFRLNGRSENLRLAQLANGAVLRGDIVVMRVRQGAMKDQRKQGSQHKRGNNATPSVPPTFGHDSIA